MNKVAVAKELVLIAKSLSTVTKIAASSAEKERLQQVRRELTSCSRMLESLVGSDDSGLSSFAKQQMDIIDQVRRNIFRYE